jgi:hypothetical protein
VIGSVTGFATIVGTWIAVHHWRKRRAGHVEGNTVAMIARPGGAGTHGRNPWEMVQSFQPFHADHPGEVSYTKKHWKFFSWMSSTTEVFKIKKGPSIAGRVDEVPD